MRLSEKERNQNKAAKSYARSMVRRTESLIKAGKVEEAGKKAELAISAIDKAAKKGVFHRNTAARSKSRLMRKLNQATGKAAS
jgi:small subunit ribosomal protein S20